LLATGDEYLVVCGTIGLGSRLAEGGAGIGERLRDYSQDSRWRVREGVVLALQRLGDTDLPRLLALAAAWAASPAPLVQRAAVAGLCEPRLLRAPEASALAVDLCEQVTLSLAAKPPAQRKDNAHRTLRQALGYCWSVAVAASPAPGLRRFQALGSHDDPDIAWIVRENSKKARLAKLLATVPSTSVADEVEARLRAEGNAERAEAQKKYLKSSLVHLGVSVGEVRTEAKRVARGLSSHDALVGTVEALWASPVYERKLCAALLLEARVGLLGEADLPLLGDLVRSSKTWALVDPLAVNVAGKLLVRFPSAASVVGSWATDDNFWLRRSALLTQVALVRAGAPSQQFWDHADAMLEEREFFIRKAIGWVLREIARRDPNSVYDWLAPRKHRASGVTTREAVKYLSPTQRESLLAD
jgi:3-methyladenine DNA glycosylase AlkD